MSFDSTQRQQLLRLARQSIELGLQEGRRPAWLQPAAQANLDPLRSCFVTLRIGDALRGCCGSVQPQHPLAEDLWRNAWASAFSDPRFPPLNAAEYPGVDVHISVLSELEPLAIATEAELIRSLRPAVDGVLLQLGASQVTFLPAVWQQLAEPADFLRQLKFKAGWRDDFWSAAIQVFRYTTESFGEAGSE